MKKILTALISLALAAVAFGQAHQNVTVQPNGTGTGTFNTTGITYYLWGPAASTVDFSQVKVVGISGGGGGGSGTVTNIATTNGITGGPITTSGTLSIDPTYLGISTNVATIAALRALSVSGVASGKAVYVAGYYAAEDGGEGTFIYNSASSATDDNGSVIQPNAGSGRWFRSIIKNGPIYATWFGCQSNQAAGDTSNDTSSIQAAINYCNANSGGHVIMPPGHPHVTELNMAGMTNVQLSGVGSYGTQLTALSASNSVIDLSGSYACDLDNFSIQNPVSSGVAPKVAILMGQVVANSGNLERLGPSLVINGVFSVAGIYVYGEPSSRALQIQIINYQPTAASGLYLTSSNAKSMTSDFVTLTTGTLNTGDWDFHGCEFHELGVSGSDTISSAVRLDGAYNVHFYGGNMSLGGKTAASLGTLWLENSANAIGINGVQFYHDSGTSPACHIYVASGTSVGLSVDTIQWDAPTLIDAVSGTTLGELSIKSLERAGVTSTAANILQPVSGNFTITNPFIQAYGGPISVGASGTITGGLLVNSGAVTAGTNTSLNLTSTASTFNAPIVVTAGGNAINATGGNILAAGNVTATLQLVSNVVTGTPPLVVSSTTNVPNLNASTISGQNFTSPTITTPVIAGGLTASGSGANDFSVSTGAFKTSTGAGTFGGSSNNFTATTAASSSTVGAVTIGNGTAATNVAIGGGNINVGGTSVLGGDVTVNGTGNGLNVANGNIITAGSVGATSTVTGSQLISNVAIGTAPLAVTSTTNVANLNASTLSGATFASPGTIGGTAPGIGNFTSTTQTLKTTTYNNVATAGMGLAVVVASPRQTGVTNTTATLATYTVPAADSTYRVSANIQVTAATTAAMTVVCTYTDETNTSRAQTIPFCQLAGTFLTSITNVTGVGPYEGATLEIRCKASTTIVFTTAGTVTGITYNVQGTVTQTN